MAPHPVRGLAAWRILVLVALNGLALYFLLTRPSRAHFRLRITAGDLEGRRSRLAETLRDTCLREQRALDLELVPTRGSGEMIERLLSRDPSRRVDLALVQGGMGDRRDLTSGELQRQHGEVRQVASLVVEPLHLLVREDLAGKGISGLRGQRVNTSTLQSGTHELALHVLRFSGLEVARDFEESNLSYSELLDLPGRDLPDAVFTVSALPSPIADYLVDRHRFRIEPLPFAEALALQRPSVEAATIPAYTYSVDPPVPAVSIPTPGTRLLLLTRRGLPDQPVTRILRTIYEGEFAHVSNIPALPEARLAANPEYPLHQGTRAFLRRRDPIVTAEYIEGLENLRSFLVSLGLALFLLWRWHRKRDLTAVDEYMDEVGRIERAVMASEREVNIDLAELIQLRVELAELKIEVLNQFTEGQIAGEEYMNAFLTHVADVRHNLSALIMHERDRLETRARKGSRHGEDEKLSKMWGRALGEFDGTISTEFRLDLRPEPKPENRSQERGTQEEVPEELSPESSES